MKLGMKMMIIAIFTISVVGAVCADAPEKQPYPRVVAHRGLSGLCPENTMPAFAAAISLGVQEIELDIWGSKDRQLVICHDDKVDRTTDGKGHIRDLTWQQIQQLDAGSWFNQSWAGVRVPCFEDVLKQFAGKIVMNVHIKEPGDDGWIIQKTCELARKYKAEKSIYIAGGDRVLKWAIKIAPDIERCHLSGDYTGMGLVERAAALKCHRLQFNKTRYDEEAIKAAHKHGIICNLFWADTKEDAQKAFALGIDSMLTNYANLVLPLLDK